MVDLKEKIAIFGLGHIGLPFTAALATVGYKVIGFDIDKEKIEMLKRGEMPFYEPGLKETLEKQSDKIEYTADRIYAIQNSTTILVTVGTPLKENNEPDYTALDAVIADIGKNMKRGQLIIFKSTVVIGTTEEHIRPKLEQYSGLKAGQDFYLVYCPERTIEGLALHELYDLPKIIGGINEESAIRAEKIMRRLGGGSVVVSCPRVAEMCKLIDNLYRASNIAFANEIGQVCEKIGIKSGEVVSAVNESYPRTKIFNPGLGADGPCLSKDPLIFKYSAAKYNTPVPLTEGCIAQNIRSTLRIAELIKEFISKSNLDSINLAIVGLAFKGFPETGDLRGSPAIKILNSLKKDLNLNSIKLYDPLVTKFPDHNISNSISEAIEDANIILFLTNHPKIMNIELEHILDKIKKPAFIVDAWGNINFDQLPEGINYFRIGHG